MNPVGDTFTVGIVLLLLIGAVAFYLYTRISQVEKRINLLENILLDLKVATENSFLGFPPPAKRAAGGGAGQDVEHEHEHEHEQTSADEEEELLSEYVPKMPTARHVEAKAEAEDDETLMYERALESALDSSPVEADEDLDAGVVAEAPSKSVEISSEAAPSAPKSEVHVNKLETNYTELNVKELRSLAQNRGITGVGKLSRKELIDALQKKDSGVVDGVESSAAPLGFESSLIGDAATIDA